MMRIFWCFILLLVFAGCESLIEDKVTEKFAKIDKEFQQKVVEKTEKRDSLLIANSNLSKLREVHHMTQTAESSIKRYRSNLEDYLKENLSDSWIDKAAQTEQMDYSLGEVGEAYRLQKDLRAYVDGINGLDPSFEYKHLANHGWEIESYKGSERAKKDFAHLYFENTSNIAAFALLSEIHSDVLSLELQVIDQLMELRENKK